MIDKDVYTFVDNNKLENIEGVLANLNSIFGENEVFKKNFYFITYLLKEYYNENQGNEKLEFLLSDISTINYLKDKDILEFVLSLVNLNNKYELSLEDNFNSLSLLLHTSKNYLDTKRSNYRVLDNTYLSILIDLYANFYNDLNSVVKEMFFLALYNSYSNINIDDLDYFEFQLTRIYNDFINDTYFKFYDVTDKEQLYEDIINYLNNYLDFKVKPKVK
jgi:hypothetical protein